MSKLCGAPTLPTDRQREHTKSNWAETLHSRLDDRTFSERGLTFAETVVLELKKLSEGQAMLARELEVQHKEVIKRLDQKYGLLASEAQGDWQPVVQPTAVDHKEPPGLSISVVGQSADVDTQDSASSQKAESEQATGSNGNAKDSTDAMEQTKSRMPASLSKSPTMLRIMDATQQPVNSAHEIGPLARLIGEYGELVMGVVIVLNMIVLCTELQLMGETQLAYDIGIVDTAGVWEEQEAHFARVEFIFTVVYTLELLVNVKVMGLAYLKEVFNVIDAMVVLFAALQAFILRPLAPGGSTSDFSVVFARILKLARIVRVVKVLKFMNTFVELRILIKTIWSSRFSLMWSVILLTVAVVAMGILIFQVTSVSIQDHSVPDEIRVWLYDHFGTWARASYTMFEATFSTAWTSKAFFMVREIHDAYAIFWVFHVVMINFALIRIVSALFLKQTMQVAALDAEQTALRELKTKEEYAGILSDIFQRADTSQDGAINEEEFAAMMVDPHVATMFRKMQLNDDEVRMLFGVLVDDDGLADYDEFLSAALKIKNTAKGIDAVQILHEIDKVKKVVANIASQGQAVSDHLERMGARNLE